MKKMKYAKIALAAIISAALLQGGTALAKKKGELSVYEWGPWAVMARPAAGPQFVSFTPKDNPDPYHPTPVPVPPTPPKPVPPTPPVPVVDHYAGWATYSWHNDHVETKPYYGRILARFAESIVPQTSQDKLDINYLDESLSPSLTVSYTVGPPVLASLDNYPQVDSLSMPGAFLGSDQQPYDPDGTFTYLEGNFPLPDAITATPIYAYKEGGAVADTDGSGNTHTRLSGMTGYVLKSEPWNLDMVVGAWGNGINHKAAGIIDSGSEGTDYEYFVYGTTTSLAAIDGLQAGNVTVNYTGTTLVNRTSVAMTINFGNGTWSGSWNGGVDGANVQTSTDSLGVVHATGHMGFNAAGHLSGSNLTTDRIFATDAMSISGVVENAVFGNKAQMVGGGYQITKTVAGGYKSATQADITIAVDQKLVDLAD